MMEFFLFTAVSFLLLLLLFFFASTPPRPAATSLESTAPPSSPAGCSPDVVRHLFCRDDWEFVAREGCPELLRSFSLERRGAALCWLRQTSIEITSAMRNHASRASRSSNLRVVDELKLFSRYAALRLFCGLLFVVLRFAHPHRLRQIAAYTSELSQSFFAAESSLLSAHGPDSSASAGLL